MRVRTALLMSLVLVGCSGIVVPAHAAQPHARAVEIQGRAFRPSDLTALVGDDVVWTNHDMQAHTVTSDAGAFDSGPLGMDRSYTLHLAAVGDVSYICSIHPFMHGMIHVYAFAVSVGVPRSPGQPVELRGLSTHTDADLVVQRLDVGGQWSDVVSARTASDGAFTVSISPEVPGMYRVVAGGEVSTPVHVGVRPGVRARLVRGAGGRGSRLLVSTGVAQPRAGARIQWYDREHFAWRPFGPIRRLDASSRGSLPVSVALRGMRIRAAVVQPVGGYADDVSAPVRVPGPFR